MTYHIIGQVDRKLLIVHSSGVSVLMLGANISKHEQGGARESRVLSYPVCMLSSNDFSGKFLLICL